MTTVFESLERSLELANQTKNSDGARPGIVHDAGKSLQPRGLLDSFMANSWASPKYSTIQKFSNT